MDVIALSDHCGTMRGIAADVMELLKKYNATDICVVAGGIIPDEDYLTSADSDVSSASTPPCEAGSFGSADII